MDDTLEVIKKLVDYYVKYKDVCDLVCVVGTYNPGNHQFYPGVEFNYFKALFDSLNNNKTSYFKKDDKIQFASYLFEDHKYITYKLDQIITYQKKDICIVDLKPVCDKKYDIRIMLQEKKTLINFLPEKFKLEPIQVSLNQTWSFKYKNYWKYRLNKIATGKNKTDAVKSSVIFDIKLNLLNIIQNQNNHSIAQHLLLKSGDLLGRIDKNQRIDFKVSNLSWKIPVIGQI